MRIFRKAVNYVPLNIYCEKSNDIMSEETFLEIKGN
jgi:hypothetical protein